MHSLLIVAVTLAIVGLLACLHGYRIDRRSKKTYRNRNYRRMSRGC
jgi:hypothetical protein